MFAHPRRKQLPIQQDLFDLPPDRPTWSRLPEEIRREAIPLLMAMLRQHLVPRDGNRQEGAHE